MCVCSLIKHNKTQLNWIVCNMYTSSHTLIHQKRDFTENIYNKTKPSYFVDMKEFQSQQTEITTVYYFNYLRQHQSLDGLIKVTEAEETRDTVGDRHRGKGWE